MNDNKYQECMTLLRKINNKLDYAPTTNDMVLPWYAVVYITLAGILLTLMVVL